MALEVLAERRLFTRAEYHRMGEVGIFTEDDRVELIRGEIPTPAATATSRASPEPPIP